MPLKKQKSTERDDRLVRLQKYLSQAGVASRRKAEELVREGRVRVGGNVVTELGSRVDPLKDIVTVDGKKIRPKKLKYLVLHKPQGVVSSRDDPQNRPTVVDMLPDMGAQLYPVGRLDYDATGLVLLTNDGDAAMALTHPSFKTPRIYIVKVKGHPDENDINRLRSGLRLDDGTKTLPAKVQHIEMKQRGRKVTTNTWLKFIIREGRNRQIKRMCLAVRHPALKIQRVAMGPLKLGDLPAGAWRPANPDEIKELKRLTQKAARKTKDREN